MDKKRKGPGRPPIANPRDVFVSARLTKGERVQLIKAAKAAGMTLQDYIRARLLD